MDFTFTEEEKAWRQEVRDFLSKEPLDSYPCENPDEGYGAGAWSNAFHRRLAEKRWVGRSWPKEYGGQERPLTELVILMEEMGYYKAPYWATTFTELFSLPIVQLGSDAIKRKFLPKAVKGEATLWEGFSEPNAGSDLLALKTNAVEKDNCWVINGQKTWNTCGHLGTHGYTAAVTDSNAPRGRNISLFLIEMNTSGVTTRPIPEMAGGTSYTEVFFDNVEVPKENLIGEKNQGFILLLGGLEGDRFWGRVPKAAYLRRLLDDMVGYCKQTRGANGRLLAEDPVIRDKLAELAVEIEACRLLNYRAMSKLVKGVRLSYEASVLHIFANELGQRFVNTALDILGLYGQLEEDSKLAPFKGYFERQYLGAVGHTLAGGTTEINKNTIARFGLKLPLK